MGNIANARPWYVAIQTPTSGGFSFVNWLNVKTVDVGTGSKLGEVTFEVDLVKLGQHIGNMSLPAAFATLVQVWFANDGTGLTQNDSVPPQGSRTCVFCGDIDLQKIVIGKDEVAEVKAFRDEMDFGYPLAYHWMTSYTEDTPVRVYEPMVFNPKVQEFITYNQEQTETHDIGGYTGVKLFVDAQRMRHDFNFLADSEEWKLGQAIKTLCATLNPNEDKIDNPSDANIAALDALADEFYDELEETLKIQPIKNVEIDIDTRLPEALDILLNPFGCDWWLDNSSGRSQIVVGWIQDAPQKSLSMAAYGQDFDFSTTNTESFEMITDIGNLYNHVVILGAKQRREVAVWLYATWENVAAVYDGDDLDDVQPWTLSKKDEDGTGLFQKYPNAWRKFAANEDGRYDGTSPAAVAGEVDLSSVFRTKVLAKRARKFLPPLSKDKDGEDFDEPIVMWYDADDYNGDGEEWAIVDENWGCKVLENELGVYFDADEPPAELMAAGPAVKICVIGTVEGDDRLVVQAPGKSNDGEGKTESSVPSGDNGQHLHSPNYEQMTLYVDMMEEFFDDQIVKKGIFEPSAATYPVKFGDRRDQVQYEDAQKVCDSKLYEVDAAGAKHNITMPGIQLGYGFFEAITGIAGRNIDFNLYARGNNNPGSKTRYPYVVRVIWDVQTSQTTLTLCTEPINGV